MNGKLFIFLRSHPASFSSTQCFTQCPSKPSQNNRSSSSKTIKSWVYFHVHHRHLKATNNQLNHLGDRLDVDETQARCPWNLILTRFPSTHKQFWSFTSLRRFLRFGSPEKRRKIHDHCLNQKTKERITEIRVEIKEMVGKRQYIAKH